MCLYALGNEVVRFLQQGEPMAWQIGVPLSIGTTEHEEAILALSNRLLQTSSRFGELDTISALRMDGLPVDNVLLSSKYLYCWSHDFRTMKSYYFRRLWALRFGQYVLSRDGYRSRGLRASPSPPSFWPTSHSNRRNQESLLQRTWPGSSYPLFGVSAPVSAVALHSVGHHYELACISRCC